PPVLGGIGGTWGSPWDALPDTARDLLGSPEFASMLFGLGAVGLARQPDGVLAEVGHSLRAVRDRRSAAAATPRAAYTDVDVDSDADLAAARSGDVGSNSGSSAEAIPSRAVGAVGHAR